MRHSFSLILVLGAACAPPRPALDCPEPAPAIPATPPPAAVTEPAPATVVTFVRHAEKANDGAKDPPLTEPGQARARCLANLLEPTEPSLLLATKYQRTRSTLGPLAEQAGLDVEVLPAADIDAWGERLRDAPPGSRIVVSAHSNTIPPIVAAIGGEPGPLDEHGNIPHEEYDRMLVVVLDDRGHVVTMRQRYCVP